MPNKPGYFEKYYEENKGKISSNRKRKYEADPEYRSRVMAASRDYREAHRSEDRIRMPRYQKPVIEKAGDGSDVVLFSVGAMAAYLDRSVQAINHWERAGVLPPTPYRDERGFRFYTTDMMAAVRDAVGNKRRLFPVDPQMRENVLRVWKECGVPVKAQSMKAALANTVAVQQRRSSRAAAK